MKKWFMAKSLADRIAMILIAAIVVAGGTTAAVIATKPGKAATAVVETTSVSDESAPLVDAAAKEETETVSEEKTEEVLGVSKEDKTSDEEETAVIEPFVKTGYDLINGDFSDGLNGFEFYAASDEYASYELNGNGIDIDIKDTGSEDWHVQLKQNDVMLESGKWYRLSLDAKSTVNRTATMTMQKNGMTDDDWTPYCNQEVMKLTNKWNHYQIVFKMDKNTDKNAVFNVSMGTVNGNHIKKAHTVSLNNIKLEKLPDNFTDTLRTDGNLVANGDFSNKSLLWETVVVAPGQADVSFAENKAVFDIKNPGTEDWHVQLKQGGIKLKKYGGYRVTFNVTSTEARMIKVGIMDKDYVIWYGGGDIHVNAGQVTPVSVEFYNNDYADNDDALLMISMGNIAGVPTKASTVTISDVKFVRDSSVYLPQYGGGASAAPSLPDGWSAYDHEGTHTKSIAAINDGVKFEIKNTGSEEWHIQYTKKNVALKKGATYKIDFDITSSVDRSIKYMIQEDGGAYTPYTSCTPVSLVAGVERHVSEEFTMNKDDSSAVFNFSLGATPANAVDKEHNIIIKNVKFELVSESSFTIPEDWTPNIFKAEDVPTDATVKGVEDGACFNIINSGVESWRIQYSKYGISLKKGGKYKVEFDMMSSIDRKVVYLIQHNGEPYTTYYSPEGGAVDLTANTNLHVSEEFTMNADSDSNCVFNFTLGTDGEANKITTEHNVIIKNVKFTVISEPEDTAADDDAAPADKVLVGKDDPMNLTDQYGSKWEIRIDNSEYKLSEFVGKKVKATAVLQSEHGFNGVIAISQNAEPWWVSSSTQDVDWSGNESTWEITAENFSQVVFQIYWKAEGDDARDIILKSLTLEVVE